MEQNILTLAVWKDIYDQWTWKLILRESAIIDMFERCLEEEHVLLDKTETDLKVDLKMTGYKNDTEKDATSDIQMKAADDLIIKRDIQITSQKSDLDNVRITQSNRQVHLIDRSCRNQPSQETPMRVNTVYGKTGGKEFQVAAGWLTENHNGLNQVIGLVMAWLHWQKLNEIHSQMDAVDFKQLDWSDFNFATLDLTGAGWCWCLPREGGYIPVSNGDDENKAGAAAGQSKA